MLRIYLDSNVYRYIKPNHPSYNKELHTLMDSMVGEVLFIYSGAHLDDLKDSKDPFRETDLKLMEKYVDTNFFYRDPINNTTNCSYLRPIEAFGQIDYTTMDQTLNNFDVDSLLFKDLDDSDESKALRNLLESVFNSSLADLGDTIDSSNFEGVNKELFNKVFVNYSPNMTLREFMNSIMPYGGKLLNDAAEVTELRNHIEKYLKSDTYSYKNWGMEFDDKLKDKIGKNFLQLIDGMLLEKQKNDVFLRFQHAYTLLELFNITKETVGGKSKKFNYWSLNNDATHCYFASMCDYLVTDDKGLQVKAQIVYSIFDIPTRILSTKDFVQLKENWLASEKTFEEFIDKLNYNISNSYFISTETFIETREVLTWYELAKPHFNVFKLLQNIEYQSGSRRVILTLVKYPNEITLLRREIELISRKIFKVLGQDHENKGEFELNETIESGLLRIWVMPSLVFQLGVEEDNGTFYVNLYMDIHHKKE